MADNAELIKKLAGIAGVKEVASGHGLHLTSTPYACWLDVDATTAKRYSDKLDAKRGDLTKVLERLRSRLDNTAYLKSAPKELVKQTHEQFNETESLLRGVLEEIERFKL